MCGLAGFLDRTPWRDEPTLAGIAGRMADALVRRGPDDRGVWADPAAGYAVGFRRLAIVDLSPQGHQPMVSASGRFVIAFNGEIYNHSEIHQELLEGQPMHFRGHSDTEVMLTAIETWGLAASLRHFAGMFAFALWDRREKTLALARDRMGEKPMYYGWAGDVFLFGSELKSLRQHPQFQGRVNRDALVPYLERGCIPAPLSVYENIFKLPPAATLTIRAGQESLPSPERYWSVQAAAAAGRQNRLTGTTAEMAGQLDHVLRRTVAEQMVADVPLGAFLSGGVDSSTIVALMQTQSNRPVKTFTVGFGEKEFNEAEFARAVARHLGTDHTDLYLAPDEALKVIPLLPELFDEPFADASQLPTYLVAQMARKQVTVSLSGDGGDEVFGGYTWYQRAAKLWSYARCLPRPLGRLVGEFLSLPGSAWERAAREAPPRALMEAEPPRHCVPGRSLGTCGLSRLSSFLGARLPPRVRKAATMFRHLDRVEDLHQWLIATHWDGVGQPPLEGQEPARLLKGNGLRLRSGGVLERLQCADMLAYLPDDILVKVDRASMGVSLESRAPFLDHRVVEFAWRVAPQFKIRDGQGKWLLRQVLYKYVPRALIERPKKGFCVPLAEWLRGPLRAWAEELLDASRLRQQGFFSVHAIRGIWREHLSGQRDWRQQLWQVLMFQAWLQHSHSTLATTNAM